MADDVSIRLWDLLYLFFFILGNYQRVSYRLVNQLRLSASSNQSLVILNLDNVSWFRLFRWFYFHLIRSLIVQEYRRLWNQRFWVSSPLRKNERYIDMSYWVLDAMLIVCLIVSSLYWRSCIDVHMLIR